MPQEPKGTRAIPGLRDHKGLKVLLGRRESPGKKALRETPGLKARRVPKVQPEPLAPLVPKAHRESRETTEQPVSKARRETRVLRPRSWVRLRSGPHPQLPLWVTCGLPMIRSRLGFPLDQCRAMALSGRGLSG